MKKLKSLPVRKIEKILKSNGFICERKGKHYIFKKRISRDNVLTTIVPNPHKIDVKKGTVASIMRQSRKPREEFC